MCEDDDLSNQPDGQQNRSEHHQEHAQHEGRTVDYTPGSDVTGGDVIVQNTLVGVALSDITSGDKGALAVEGVFDFPKATGVGTAIAAGKAVYWDVADVKAKEDDETGANMLIGKTVAAAGVDDTTVRVKLNQ